MKKIILAVSLALIFAAQAARAQASNTETATDWRIKLNQELPLLGHRNWIMIVDSAYPLQVSPGVETIETGADLPQVLRVVHGTLC